MWEQAAAQAAGRWLAASEQDSRTIRSGIERLAYSADGYTVTTGGSRASGASLAKSGDPLSGFMAPLTASAQTVAQNPTPWIAGAVAVLLIAAVLRRRKG